MVTWDALFFCRFSIVAINQSKLSSSSHKPGFCQFELSRRGRLHLNSTYNLITEKLLFYFQHIRQSRMEMGTLLLDVLCLIVTLDSESHSIFPQVFASCLLFFKPLSNWKDANKEVMNRLCYFVLPKCLGERPIIIKTSVNHSINTLRKQLFFNHFWLNQY